MLAEKILKALNEQIKHEATNQRLYLQMAGWCDGGSYPGVAKWFYSAAGDEHDHMMKVINYVAERNCKFEMLALDKPPCDFAGVLELFTQTMGREIMTTKALSDLYRLAMTEGDYLTSEFLLPMLKEQVEEENKVQDVLDFIKLAGNAPPGLALIDSKLAG